MGRPFYLNEVEDPDLDWLISNFLYERPDFIPVETDLLPLVLLPYCEQLPNIEEIVTPLPVVVGTNDATNTTPEQRDRSRDREQP